MIYTLSMIVFLICSLFFIFLNWEILIENNSCRIPPPPIISKKPKTIENEINKAKR
jgi:hypothetical protein